MTFDALGIAGSSMNVHRKLLDAVSDNIANVNTVTSTDQDAFRARYIQATAGDSPTGGVFVQADLYGDAEGRLVYEPGHPLADGEGYVRYPDIDLGEQMTSLIIAQRGYQAQASTVERSRAIYEAGIQIGK
jgi:flagellar basal-body rod protein FlgC